MPRPVKCRRVCEMPQTTEFMPRCGTKPKDVVVMTVDEYETIRLIDHEGLLQEDAAKRMNVARTTAQAIYMSARKKVAEALVDGKKLRIEGGEIELCAGSDTCPKRASCPKWRFYEDGDEK